MKHFILLAGLLMLPRLLWSETVFDPSSPYYFDGKISRPVLERYLDRSVTATNLLRKGQKEGNVFPYTEDGIRMVQHIGAKFIGRAIFCWGGEAVLGDTAFIGNATRIAARLHKTDPEMVLQACLFEYVSSGVNRLAIPSWVFEAFGLPVEERNFDSQAMVKHINPNAEILWGENGGGVPMVNNLETQLWYYFLARTYIDIGCEALHLGQVDLISGDDPSKGCYDKLIFMIRQYAAQHARRHYVLLDGHVPLHGFIRHGVSLLDFNSFPLRIKEVVEHPMQGELKAHHLDALFCVSEGAIAPSGWQADHMPYLVEFDNFGRSTHTGVANTKDHFCWGYDEITWFALQSEEYRNSFLWYAFDWLRRTDPNGHLQMPLIRVISCDEGARTNHHYFANTQSEACPIGYSQEEAIKAIWDSRLK